MSNKIKFGIVGCGTIAEVQMRALEMVEGAEVTAVMSASEATSRSWGEKYHVASFTDMESLLRDGDIDAVTICTPSGLHAQQAIQALQAGKHVVVEKPMAITRESLEAMLQAEKESSVSLFPICQLRLSPDVRRAKELISQGALGKLVMADLSMKSYRSPEYYQQKKWRGTWALDGGGALMNQGIHGLDLLRYLCGDVREVSCRAGTLCRDIEAEDTLAAVMTFEHGGFGVMTATTSVYPGYQRRIEICGTDGSLVLFGGKLIELKTRSGLTLETDVQVPPSSNDPRLADAEQHIMQFEDIVRAINTGSQPMLTSADAAASVRLILDLYESAGIGYGFDA